MANSAIPLPQKKSPSLLIQRVPLWLLVLLSLLGYVVLARWFPLIPRFGEAPPGDVRTFAPTLVGGLGYGLLLCGLYGLYGLGVRRVGMRLDRPRLALLVATAVLFSLPLLLTYPINANDLYRYVIRGRVSSTYGTSPYSAPPSDFPDDPFLPLAGEWAGETSPYGPLWELTAGAVTAVSGNNLLLGMLLFKGVGLAAHVGTAVVIWLILSLARASRERRAAYTLLWAWNPSLLLFFVMDAHNDVVMLLWMVLGVLLTRLQRPVLGFLALALGALTKPVGLLALPLFFLALLRGQPDGRARLRFATLSVGGALLLGTLAFLPFGAPWELALRLLREASGAGGFSPLALLILVGRTFFGLPMPAQPLTWTALLLFGLLVMWLLWTTWHGRSPLRSSADVFLGYSLQAFSFRIWYTAWPFPWLLLDAADNEAQPWPAYRLRVGLWFLLTVQLSVIIYGHVRIFWLGSDMLWAHLIGVPFTFGLPFLLAALTPGWGKTPVEMPG